MSAPNFASVNTSKIFAFGATKYIDQEAIDANDWPQEWLGDYDEEQTQADFEWCQENAVEQLEQKGWTEDDGSDGDRSYCGSYIAKKAVSVYVGGCYLDITVRAKVVSGYYSGATFDFDAELTVENDLDGVLGDYDLTGSYAASVDDVITDNWTGNNGLSKIQAKNIIRRLYSELEKLTDQAEEVFQNCSEHRLACVGIMSNGEGVYEDIETRRGQLKAAVAQINPAVA